MTDVPVWLDEDQEQVWRALLQLTTRLPAVLNRQLTADSGLSLPDMDVLVALGDLSEDRARVSGLARTLGWERSRVSHQVARMERSGLVCRLPCEDDGRGAYVGLTDAGRRVLVVAAPTHVAFVRTLFVDALDGAELRDLGTLVEALLDRIATVP